MPATARIHRRRRTRPRTRERPLADAGPDCGVCVPVADSVVRASAARRAALSGVHNMSTPVPIRLNAHRPISPALTLERMGIFLTDRWCGPIARSASARRFGSLARDFADEGHLTIPVPWPPSIPCDFHRPGAHLKRIPPRDRLAAVPATGSVPVAADRTQFRGNPSGAERSRFAVEPTDPIRRPAPTKRTQCAARVSDAEKSQTLL